MPAPQPHKAADPSNTRIQQALQAQDWPALVRHCRQALRRDRRHLLAHRTLGFALNQQRQTEAAFQAYRLARALWPRDAELLINYANTLIEHARPHEALPMLETVCELSPNEALSWIKLAQCCYALQLNDRGFEAAQRAEALAEDVNEKVASLTQKAIHRRELGQVREAVQDCEAAIALNPYDTANHTNRLLFMLADPLATSAQLTQAAREYGAIMQPTLPAPDFNALRADGPWKRLRVGFLSPDFRAHSVMYFTEGLLAQLDRRQFEVFAYYLYPRDDSVTTRVACHADHFVRLAGLTAEQQAQRIRDDGIDILIELAGHTGHNGLPVLAQRAAPVQVSWLGFPATTGLANADYRITDEVTDPSDADAQYTERLVRLPTLFCCYRPMSRNPLWRYQPRYCVSPLPALHKGHVTFGSCNNLGKLTDEVLALWGRILREVPTSHLLIEGKNFEKPEFAQAYRQRCERLGVPVNRLELVPLDAGKQYLTYHRIDIALDPFPLTGGTTSFDVLWMGVPLVSMEGDSFKSRMGAGILAYLGRTEWLATTADAYVQIAASLAADIPGLGDLRQGLRAEVEQSPLMREGRFNQLFGLGLRSMWWEHLAVAQAPDDAEFQAQRCDEWARQAPPEWATPAPLGVGLRPGQRVALSEAHQRLQDLTEKAKTSMSPLHRTEDQITHRHWIAVTELAESVLCASPHDPVALACLAEVEHAHGHTDFAVTYLKYAMEAMGVAPATA